MLNGLTVLDLSSVGPGPRCSWILADLGADVGKVVAPASANRIEPPFHTYGAGRGTRRVEIDLKTDAEAFLSLVEGADAVVESFRPGVADRLGIGYEACKARNGKIVYAAITGYGQDGDFAQWAGHDINYLAMSGYIACQSNVVPGATVADSAGGGMHAAVSILAALLRRERTGEGAYLDVSTTNGALYLMALQIDQYLATGEEAGPRTTLLTGKYACYDTYECADGKWVAVGAIEGHFFRNLCEALGLSELASAQMDDTRQDELRAAIAAAFKTRPRDEWVCELASKDTCVGPVLSVAEAAETFPTQDAGGFQQLKPLIAGSD